MPNLGILGLDGLEYRLIEKWQLKNLMQTQHRKIKVPIHPIGVPYTPDVWASFLTGKWGLNKEFQRKRAPLQPVFKALRFIRGKTGLNKSLGIGKRLSPKLTKPTTLSFGRLQLPTFLEDINLKPINFPYVNFDNKEGTVIRHYGKGRLTLRQAHLWLDRLYCYRKKQTLTEADNNICAHMFFPDLMMHYHLHVPPIKRHYHDLDRYIANLSRRFRMFIIVSDHGFSLEAGTHTPYGFYSCNRRLNPTPRKITDFYKIFTNK